MTPTPYDFSLSQGSSMGGFQMPKQPDYLSSLLNFGQPAGPNTGYSVMDGTGPMLSRPILDGTNVFGGNSAPGAWGDWGSLPQSPVAPGPMGSIWDSPLQTRNANGTTSGGYLSAGLGLAQGLGGLYLGMQQYNLAKDTLANNKAQFERNYAAQKATTNASLEDRQRARVASNAGAYQSVGDYMNQNGVR